ncbi:uncharacterized protein LOC144616409 isoform X1 [Panthera onca]
MDGLVGACGRGPPVFGAVLVARRDWPELRCSRSPRRPPFHILRRRRGQPRRRLFTRCLWNVTVEMELTSSSPVDFEPLQISKSLVNKPEKSKPAVAKLGWEAQSRPDPQHLRESIGDILTRRTF